jgi:hypothetical protein
METKLKIRSRGLRRGQRSNRSRLESDVMALRPSIAQLKAFGLASIGNPVEETYVSLGPLSDENIAQLKAFALASIGDPVYDEIRADWDAINCEIPADWVYEYE